MIVSFADKRTEKLASGSVPKGFPNDIILRTRALLTALHAAEELNDLRFPPGNRLEKLSGKRANQYSIRVNRQWRVCFNWTDQGPANVEIVDYH